MIDPKRLLRITVLALGAFIIGLIGWRLGRMQGTPAAEPIASVPDYGTVADFNFTDQSGKPFGLKDLKGKIWVADFVFTRCMGPCPMLTTRMAALQKEMKGQSDLRFVSFSVDPDYDAPNVLASYAKTYGADGSTWHFLTGPKEKIYALIRSSFHLAVAPGENQKPSITDILHSLYFVLVDRNGKVLGYFNTDEEAALDKLKNQIHAAAHS
jgi:protein SCO1/2